jgi:hypothetical protein
VVAVHLASGAVPHAVAAPQPPPLLVVLVLVLVLGA